MRPDDEVAVAGRKTIRQPEDDLHEIRVGTALKSSANTSKTWLFMSIIRTITASLGFSPGFNSRFLTNSITRVLRSNPGAANSSGTVTFRAEGNHFELGDY